MSIRPMSARSDIESAVWATLTEALEAGVDPDAAIAAARSGIDKWLSDCLDWAAQADGE